MDPHPLANLFKRSNYDEPIASEFCALDYLYEVLLEIHKSENFDEILPVEPKKIYIPRMIHPFKRQSFEKFIEKQNLKMQKELEKVS